MQTEGSNKVVMAAWVRFADKAETRQGGQWAPDGSLPLNGWGARSSFSYCRQLSHLSMSRKNTDVTSLCKKAQTCHDNLQAHIQVFYYQ